MNISTSTIWARLKSRVLPAAPNFYELLGSQCDLLVETMEVFLKYMQFSQEHDAERVCLLEHRGDRLKSANLAVLHSAFSTPIDREDIYDSISAIDEILNYAKTTVREMQLFDLAPDDCTRTMVALLLEGTRDLQGAYAQLEKFPLLAEARAEAARKTERKIELTYRRALKALFDPGRYLGASGGASVVPSANAAPDLAVVVNLMTDALKRREIYRHLSNAADRVVRSAEIIRDIVAKVA